MTEPRRASFAIPLLVLTAVPLCAEEPAPRLTIRGLPGRAASLAFSPDGNLLASGTVDGSVTIWEVASGKKLSTLRAHDSPVVSLAFGGDPKTLASAGTDGAVRVWDIETGEAARTVKGPRGLRFALKYGSGGNLLAAAPEGKSVRLWNGKARSLEGHGSDVGAVAFGSDGAKVASGDFRGGIKLWDADTGDRLADSNRVAGSIRSLALSPDGKLLAVGDSMASLRLCALPNLRPFELKSYGDDVESIDDLAFAPDGTLLAAGIGDAGEIELWDPVSRGLIAVLPAPHLGTLTFSPDSTTLASAHWDSGPGGLHMIKLWDVQKVTEKP